MTPENTGHNPLDMIKDTSVFADEVSAALISGELAESLEDEDLVDSRNRYISHILNKVFIESGHTWVGEHRLGGEKFLTFFNSWKADDLRKRHEQARVKFMEGINLSAFQRYITKEIQRIESGIARLEDPVSIRHEEFDLQKWARAREVIAEAQTLESQRT